MKSPQRALRDWESSHCHRRIDLRHFHAMKAAIALGTNIEPRLLHLQAARRELLKLQEPDLPVPCSRVYETSPVDCPEGSLPFLNAVLELTTSLSPEQLLHELHAMEERLGRPLQHARNSPRTIDLDILYCDDLTLSTAYLVIPHPRLHLRLFVLKPLSDLRPDLVLPNFTKSVKELAAELTTDEDVKIYSNSIY